MTAAADTTTGTTEPTATTGTGSTTRARALAARVLGLADRSRPEGQAFVAAVAGTEIAKATGNGTLEKACKPLIVPTALTVALRDGDGPRGGLGRVDTALLAVAGLAYTTGDVILMLGDGHASRAVPRLAAGAAAFGVGHLALGGLMRRSGLRFKPAQTAVHAVVAGAAGAVLLAEGRENAPLAAYGALLAGLSALATSVDRSSGPGASVLATAGPVFLVSDSLILLRRRVQGGSVLARALDVGVIDTYSGAALLLLTGTAAAARTARDAS